MTLSLKNSLKLNPILRDNRQQHLVKLSSQWHQEGRYTPCLYLYSKMASIYLLFGTVNELKLVGSFKRCLNTGVFPQLLCMFVELLQRTQPSWRPFSKLPLLALIPQRLSKFVL